LRHPRTCTFTFDGHPILHGHRDLTVTCRLKVCVCTPHPGRMVRPRSTHGHWFWEGTGKNGVVSTAWEVLLRPEEPLTHARAEVTWPAPVFPRFPVEPVELPGVAKISSLCLKKAHWNAQFRRAPGEDDTGMGRNLSSNWEGKALRDWNGGTRAAFYRSVNEGFSGR